MHEEEGKSIVVIVARKSFFGFTVDEEHVSVDTIGDPHLLSIDCVRVRIGLARCRSGVNISQITARMRFSDTRRRYHVALS